MYFLKDFLPNLGGRMQDSENKIAGQQIKSLRLAAGLSQEALALEAEVDQSGLSKVERNGPQCMNWQAIFRIADALGCVVKVQFIKK